MLWDTSGNPGLPTGLKVTETRCRTLKDLQLQSLEVYGPKPIWKKRSERATKERASALMMVRPVFSSGQRERIAELAAKNRMASTFYGRQNL